MLQQEGADLKAELRTQSAAAAKATRELDNARQELAVVEAELEGLKVAMASAQQRCEPGIFLGTQPPNPICSNACHKQSCIRIKI